MLSSICIDNDLSVINNLKTPDKYLKGNKTYRKGGSWISELDTCITSRNLVANVIDFCVLQRDDLPSDHAPIAVTIESFRVDLDDILARATLLGSHSAELGCTTRHLVTRKPAKFCNIDKQKFIDAIAVTDIMDDSDVNVLAESVSDVLYDCSEEYGWKS